MELLLLIVALALLDLAALRWGADSRSDPRGHPGTGGLLPQGGAEDV